MCVEGVKKFVATRGFDCPHTWAEEGEIMPEELEDPCYQFNWAESLGNELLTPMHWVFIQLRRSDDLCNTVIISIIGIAAAIIGVFGAAFKLAGELVNPHSARRYEAIEKDSELNDLVEQLLVLSYRARLPSTNGICIDLTNIFRDDILKGLHKASDEEIAKLDLYVKKTGGVVDLQSSDPITRTAHFQFIKTSTDLWKEKLLKYAAKIDAEVDAPVEKWAIQN